MEVPRAGYLWSEDRTAHNSAGDSHHPDKDERFLPVYPRLVLVGFKYHDTSVQRGS